MEYHALYLSGIVALGIAAQWIAWRIRFPAILLLLVFGFAGGQLFNPERYLGPGQSWIPEELLFPLVSLSVAVILFEGGLSLRLREVRETGKVVLRLVSLGALVTWLLAALAAWLVLDFDPLLAMLSGAILVVTGPTVIGPLLRHIHARDRIGSVAKWEGIVIDPFGAVLAVLVFEAGRAGGFQAAALAAVGGVAKTVLVGGIFGLAGAGLLVIMLRRFWIPDYLHNSVFLAVIVISFSASNWFQAESGLLTVTLLGIVLANQNYVRLQHIVEFKENLRVLLISMLFVLLASRVRLDDITSVGWPGVWFVGLLIVVVRPVSILIATLGTELTVRERCFLACLAPRGIVAAAVASVFALQLTHLANAGELSPAINEQAAKLAPLTFLVIVGTVAVYGLLAAPIARWLDVAVPDPQGVLFAGGGPLSQAIAETVQQQGFTVLLVDANHRNVAAARMAGIPALCANILSEFVGEEIDFGGIGRLLAMTPNDEVNTLATQQFVEEFSLAGVYQLPSEAAGHQRQTTASSHSRGRLLFSEEATYGELNRRVAAGDIVKTTRMTEEFDFEAFKVLYGPDALPLFLIEPSGKLTVCAADQVATPQPGQTLISLVRDVPADAETQNTNAETNTPVESGGESS